MPTTWRDELVEVIKSKAEREAEEAERRRKRLEEALSVADEALGQAKESLGYAHEALKSKAQPASLEEEEGGGQRLVLGDQSVRVSLSRETAVLEVGFNDARPREFDFSKDRHLAPRDVEEYVGRRLVELARAAQKADPW
ncbi:MAG: hypothetical protein R3B72_03360 [Polyangiaceae bacterium]